MFDNSSRSSGAAPNDHQALLVAQAGDDEKMALAPNHVGDG